MSKERNSCTYHDCPNFVGSDLVPNLSKVGKIFCDESDWWHGNSGIISGKG